MEKRRYWLKIEKDFLKSSQIKVIKAMPNGKEYVLFYLALMLESLEHVGHLRFNETVPYNEEMLAAITDTNVDVVRSALRIFSEIGLLTILEDSTIFLKDVVKMTGKESESAERVRQYRQKALHCNNNVQNCNTNKEKHITEKINREYKQRIDNKENKENKEEFKADKPPIQKRFIPPTVEDVKKYCDERKNNIDAERFIDYYTANGWFVGKTKMKDWKATVRTWEKNNYNTKVPEVDKFADYNERYI